MDRDDWDRRYAGAELIWGAEPNRFVAAELGATPPRGRALDVACGEGRNAIWLAKLGWAVTAVDFSTIALERGRRLAAAQHVQIEWVEADVLTYAPAAGAFQLALIAYLHVPEAERQAVLARAAAALGAGGTLLLVGHARRNLHDGVGGPQQANLLWEPSEIRAEVAALGLRVQRAEEVPRPVETADGVVDAIDAVLRAERPQAGA